MTISSNIEQAVAKAWPPDQWCQTHVVVAVSGGADSVALLAALCRLKKAGPGVIVPAHFHHGLRAAEADADEQFVRQLCERLGLSLVVGRGDVAGRAERQGDGVEAAAREARYAFLLQTARQHGARCVATAHTADDQAETILHHILRGTGIAGLSGMPAARPLGGDVTLVRPLLAVRRAEVEAYLSERNLDYCEDSTNRDVRYTRNRIRHELMPRLESDYNANVRQSLLRLGNLAGQCQAVIDTQAAELATRAADSLRDSGVTIDTTTLSIAHPYLVREVLIRVWRNQHWPLQGMGFDDWEKLASMALGQPPSQVKHDFPGGVFAEKKGHRLWLTRLDDEK